MGEKTSFGCIIQATLCIKNSLAMGISKRGTQFRLRPSKPRVLLPFSPKMLDLLFQGDCHDKIQHHMGPQFDYCYRSPFLYV